MSQLATGDYATTRDRLKCELAAEILRSFGGLRLRTTGASMLPAVWPGDVLFVRRHDPVEAVPGDVILFWCSGRLVAHRVVARTIGPDGVQWITRGDSLAGRDPAVSKDQVLGCVTAIERGARRLSLRQSRASRLISWLLRRSDFSTRVVLGLGRMGSGFRLRDS
jgi:signal peptidase I